MQAVGDVLGSASEVKKRPSEEVDEKFALAINVLSCYEMLYHHTQRKVRETMAAAKEKDGSASSILNTLKEKLRKQVRFGYSILLHSILISYRPPGYR